MISNKEKYKCKKCNLFFDSRHKLGAHARWCYYEKKTKPKKQSIIKMSSIKKIDENNFECPYCKLNFCRNGIATHIWRKHTDHGVLFNSTLKEKFSKVKRVSWNKGLTKETDERVKKTGETLKNNLSSGKTKPAWLGRKHSEETLKKLSLNSGGYRKGSGRGKSGWYKGFYCDSSWELAYVIFCLENNIKLIRNTEKFDYIFENKKHKYLPDFKIDEKFIEIKGYLSKIDVEKINQFPKNKKLIILGKQELKEVFDYVENKYGKNYIKLYEKKP